MFDASRIVYGSAVSVLLWAAAGQTAPPAGGGASGLRDSLPASISDSLSDSTMGIPDSVATESDSSTGTTGRVTTDTGRTGSPGTTLTTARATQPRPAPVPPAAPVDSIGMFLDNPRHGIGIAWTLGSFELFSEWESGLPDSLGSLQLTRYIRYAQLGIAADDTFDLRFVVRERPDAYNVNFPLHLAWTPRPGRARFLTVEAAAFYAGKTWLGAVSDDSLHYTLEINHRLSFVSLSLGTSYHYSLPREYFGIDGVDASYLVAGIGIAPLSALFQSTSFKKTGPLPDSLKPFSMYLDTAKLAFSDHTAFGIGITWHLGISSLKLARAGRGVSFGIYYVGQWYGYFHEKGTRVSVDAVNPHSRTPRDALASLGHRLEVQVQLVRGKKPPPLPQGAIEE